MPIITKVNLLKDRRTKIIATLGPASQTPAKIKALIEAGADLIRLNLSHGDHKSHRDLYHHVRDIAEQLGKPIAIIGDLCGPKIRTGRFKNGAIDLVEQTNVTVTTRDVLGEAGLIPSQYGALAGDVKPGDRILLADGVIELRVDDIAGTEVFCTVIDGGTLSDHKGINLPGVNVSAPALTEKDRSDARFVLDLGVDFLALSFVRRASDLTELRLLVQDGGYDVGIIAKIEKPEALENGREILAVADAIMVARGDLGVELDPEEVPIAQHQLIDRARSVRKPVIVATQMLESMMDNARPTRAEVTDISHAVMYGTDAVMLSGETAAGAYPVKAVEMMARIAKQTEAYTWRLTEKKGVGGIVGSGQPIQFGDAVAQATAKLASDLCVSAILVITQGGMSAATVTAARPTAPIIAISSSHETCRRMNLLWGLIPLVVEEVGIRNPNEIARTLAAELQLAKQGSFILLVRGFNSDRELNTPSVTVLQI